jgi:hypothetical protein
MQLCFFGLAALTQMASKRKLGEEHDESAPKKQAATAPPPEKDSPPQPKKEEDAQSEYASVERIVNVWNPFDNCWSEPVTHEDVQKAYDAKKVNQEKFDPVRSEWSTEDRARRIAWFMNTDPSKWGPIVVECGVPSYNIEFDLVDGNHRLAAAIMLKLDRIRAALSGDVSQIDHFKAQSSAPPTPHTLS